MFKIGILDYQRRKHAETLSSNGQNFNRFNPFRSKLNESENDFIENGKMNDENKQNCLAQFNVNLFFF